jgi:two-component system, CitB family, sensor kinase
MDVDHPYHGYMFHMVSVDTRRWSLARQLVLLQMCVVVTAVTIEAMVAIYHGPVTATSLEQRQILGLVTLTEVALLVGVAGSLFVADRVRRQTFDMEPAEIARRYQHHDAMLHAVREGLIITGIDGDIVLANDEARRLLELSDDCEGRPLRDQVAGAEWAVTRTPVTDQLQYGAERVLMVSRSQAEVNGRPAGMVTTLRDRTELQNALHELGLTRVLAGELRKQAHEHANHLQRIIALIAGEKYEDAIDLCAKYAEMPQLLSDQMIEQVADPVLAACLQVLHARAKRCGVEFRMTGTLDLAWRGLSDDLADVVGIVSDNAIDAAEVHSASGLVRLSLAAGADGSVRVCVRDNGRGIAAEPIGQVFAPGWSTKGDGHGFGLARAHDIVRRLHGTITAHNDGGAVFEVCIPAPQDQRVEWE